MKILGVCGRGIEGCGQTKYMIETKRALESVGHVCDIVASMDRSFVRNTAHSITLKSKGKFSESEYMDEVISLAESYDLIIVFCLPDVKISEDAKKNFIRFLNTVKTKMIYIMVDHNTNSVNNNACLEETCRRVDLILVHSLEGAMATWVRSRGISTPIDYLYTSRNFDEMRNEYWKPVSEMDLKRVTWIGRMALWKKPKLFIDFANAELCPNGYVATLEGIEKSLAYSEFFKKQGYLKYVDNSRYNDSIKSGDHTNLKTEKPYLYGMYKFEEEMERLSLTGFGADLYTLKPKYYGRSLEQCHNDIVACGCIPIMSRHFGYNCHTLENRRWIDACPDAVYLDENNFSEAFSKIEKYRKDPILFDETREKIYEFFKTQGDISVIGPKFDGILHKVLDDGYASVGKNRSLKKLW